VLEELGNVDPVVPLVVIQVRRKAVDACPALVFVVTGILLDHVQTRRLASMRTCQLPPSSIARRHRRKDWGAKTEVTPTPTADRVHVSIALHRAKLIDVDASQRVTGEHRIDDPEAAAIAIALHDLRHREVVFIEWDREQGTRFFKTAHPSSVEAGHRTPHIAARSTTHDATSAMA
jgi:hypothetical protein